MAQEYLNGLTSSRPDAAEAVMRLQPLIERKLWHQLTVAIEEEMKNDWLQVGDSLAQFYEYFIKEFESKINPVKRATFAVEASRKFVEHESAISFLTEGMGRMKISKQEKESAEEEAKIMYNCEIAMHKMATNQMDETKEMMKAAQTTLDGMSEISDLTYSFFYKLAAEYHKKKETPPEYYRSTLQYLTYTPIDTLPSDQQVEIARDLCLSAIAAESLFTFGELLQHPVLKSLEGTDHEWMSTMLKALNVGNIAAFDAVLAKDSAKINAFPIMVSSQTLLREKLSIAALIELIFRRKADERLIPFTDIAEGTHVPLDRVEHLLIKALSLKLIRGVIDEVDQNVHITWAIPHALDMEQIAVMKDNLVEWQEKCTTTSQFVEDQSPELFT